MTHTMTTDFNLTATKPVFTGFTEVMLRLGIMIHSSPAFTTIPSFPVSAHGFRSTTDGAGRVAIFRWALAGDTLHFTDHGTTPGFTGFPIMEWGMAPTGRDTVMVFMMDGGPAAAEHTGLAKE